MIFHKLKIKESIYLTSGKPAFSILNEEENELTNSPSQCKEFVLDWTQKEKLYHKLRIYVDGWENHIEESLDFLHQLETELNFEKSKAYSVPNKPESYVFTGDKKWLISSPMLSLYLLSIRTIHKAGDPWRKSIFMPDLSLLYGNEVIWRTSLEGVEFIIKHGVKKVFGENVSKNWDIPFVHGQGIHSFSDKFMEKHKPEFYKLWT